MDKVLSVRLLMGTGPLHTNPKILAAYARLQLQIWLESIPDEFEGQIEIEARMVPEDPGESP